jgi:hypothetical protein
MSLLDSARPGSASVSGLPPDAGEPNSDLYISSMDVKVHSISHLDLNIPLGISR